MSSNPVHIPADIDREDRVLASLTARQLVILAIAGLLLYCTYTATRDLLPLPVFLILAIPAGTTIAVIALGRRDGLPLDQLLLAAVRQRLSPRHRVAAPEGIRSAPAWLTAQVNAHNGADRAPQIAPAPLRLPAEGVTDAGVLDLGADGLALVATASTVNFSLRTPAEQEGLVGVFGRFLHSLTAPLQILIRTQRLDLTPQIADLRATAGGLPHPALEQAALEHADYLTQLADQTDLLRRQVLIVLREPLSTAGPTALSGGGSPLARWTAQRTTSRTSEPPSQAPCRAAEARLVRRLAETVQLLAPAGITVTALDPGQATAVLAAACDPDSLIPPSAQLAGADEVITTTPDSWDTGFPQHSWPTEHHHASSDDEDDDGWDDHPTADGRDPR